MMGLYSERLCMSEKPKFVRPLLVVRASSITTSIDSLIETSAVTAQVETIRQFARDLKRGLKRFTLIKRTQSKFDPASCKLFQNVLESCESETEIILIDDYLRLIDFRDPRQALDQGAYLQSHARQLYSITHGSFVSKIHPSFMKSAIKDRVRRSELKSKSIKKGLKKNEDLLGGTKPTRKAVDKGAKRKSNIADHRARILLPEIERIRQTMPSDSKDNLRGCPR